MEEQPAVDPQQNLDRPARKQVPGPVTSDKSSREVNVWSGRRLGPKPDGASKAEKRWQPSQYRCHPATDTGKTRGSDGQINTFCLFFAKGMCYLGPACTFLHRLPTSADEAAMVRDTSRDIFGRDKLPDNLDNRQGAGSYDRDMTTLYVNYGGAGHYATPQLRHLLLQDFGCYGPLRSVHIVPAKAIAFVRFHWRASAEFAKEAMDGQRLRESTMHEVLAVRWANDDPNPAAVFNKKRHALDAAESAAMAAWEAMPAEEKRARLAVAQQARARQVSAVAAAMPQMLLEGAAGAGLLQGSTSRQQFDDWRGIPGRELEHHQQDEEQQQQQQEGHDGSWTDAHWAEYHAAHPEAYAQCQQHYYEQQQQQQDSTTQGAWYEGWRQRHRPEADSGQVAAAAGGSGSGAAGAGESAGAGGLGLLAGYGSGSESDDEEAGGKQQQQQQHQQQQQTPQQPPPPHQQQDFRPDAERSPTNEQQQRSAS